MSRPAEYEAFTFPLLESSGTNQSESGGSSLVVELDPHGQSDLGGSNNQLSIVALPTPISEIGMNNSDQRRAETSVAGRPPDSLSMANMNPQPPPNTTLPISMSFLSQGTGNLGRTSGEQGPMVIQPPPHPPPPHCQIMSPFMQTPPLAPLDARLPQQVAGSSLPVGPLVHENTMSNAFGPDLRHHRGYPNIMTRPPAFQMHPSVQSQIHAFQSDMNQQGHMTQPPGFLQGFVPTDMNVASVVQQQTESNSRASHLLQPHVRQRARRRSRASRALQHHVHHHATHHHSQQEGGDDEGGGIGLRSRSISEVPTARIAVAETGAGFGDTSIAAVGATTARLEDSNFKGLEENYGSIGENFECNICFQKANEAVVTCCGHLFCWPCLYRWLHIHSYHKECPVCKGAIDESSITPIYGRECSALLSARGGLPGGSTIDRVPPRPSARRVESARQLREREDRSREREQRERALEREHERDQDQQDTTGLIDIQVLGSGTTLQIEETTSTTMMRDDINDQTGQLTTTAEGEITNQETSGNSNLEEIDQSEGTVYENNVSRGDGSTPSRTNGPTSVNNASFNIQQGTQNGGRNDANNTRSAFHQRHISERREQLRAVLTMSAQNGMNSTSVSNFTDRMDERRQMIAAALLSQEWEDIMNVSRVVGPVNSMQAMTWMTNMQGGRYGVVEGTTTNNLDGDFSSNSSSGYGGVVMHTLSRPSRQQHHMSQILLPTPMDIRISRIGNGNELSLNRLVTVNPVQSGELVTTMRPRLSSVEKTVENQLEGTPLQVVQQSSSGLLQISQLLPAQSSALHARPLMLETTTDDMVANSDHGSVSIHGLVEEICPNVQSPGVCTSMESPRTTRVDEEMVMAIVQLETITSQPEPTSAGTSGRVTIPESIHNARTTAQTDTRLHYHEAPLSRPSSSRRRSSRMEDVTSPSEGPSATGSGGTAGTRQENIRSRSKRRRLN